jgi:hypothetical protein
MTWKEYKDGVYEFLTSDAERFGTEKFIEQLVRGAAIDLQIHIPRFQFDQSTFYTHLELAQDRNASVGSVPLGARVKEWWLIDSDLKETPNPDNKVLLEEFNWSDRESLAVNGIKCTGRPAYTLGPDRKDFYITPALDEETNLLINWDGVQRDWEDETPISFPEAAIRAAYYFVKGHILLDTDDNSKGLIYFNESARNPGWYQEARSTLYIEANR